MRIHRNALAGAVVVAAAIVALAPSTSATPPSGVTVEQLGQVDVSGFSPFAGLPSVYTFRRITIAPGGTLGWHYHDGNVLAVVTAGEVTRSETDCVPITYSAGQGLSETVGPDHVHVGRNLGSEPAELYVAYLNRAGEPLFVDAPAPDCP
ncbi:cupin domain-containing protein [Nocardia cyriacigeorgica]|uniref:Cupin domain-containing protein n=1 Tax=Nocardia cyriacigeorgica TaxID=135487 RepID=A0A6P1D760_9NOCA|nr:cupin domain-containing protein [Nocardia cyriacigeorgica]NEW40851.1 cupin domain-containing protein [Nocardia cyriacigeorgica]NEW45908.1 cupin domain-containing protein [Nocardia cyriacigeorgica]NEW50939.1 cupin domain-containing protein [Nocardia cyriacigeorgica]NEW55679.1 cupin domain-containing protein [Nocardia cyriacigeorgica]